MSEKLNYYNLIHEQLKLNKKFVRIREDRWDISNSTITSYEESFAHILEGKKIVDFVKSKHSPVVLDLMSSTTALETLSLSIEDNLRLGLAVCRKDTRGLPTKNFDERLNIKELESDIVKGSTWIKIAKILEGKADLIMERGLTGEVSLPANRYFYGSILKRLWNILSNNHGMILLQVPQDIFVSSSGAYIYEWVNFWKEKGIDVSCAEKSKGSKNVNAIKFIKDSNSPEKLPLLP